MNQTMRYRAANNQELVEFLKRKGVIKSQRIFDVMSKVDRKKYVNNHNPYNDAYIDSPQNIGNGRTISAPHMVGVVLETLNGKLFNGSKVLSIRCSTGYLSACMALLVGPTGKVVQVESNLDVQHKVKANITNDDPSLLLNSRITLIMDEEVNGYSPEAPYDVIYIGAAVSEVPQNILNQLAVDGHLLVPMMDSKSHVDGQMLTLIKRTEFGERLRFESLIPVRYGILNNNQINKAVSTKNGSPAVPKILKTPAKVSPCSSKTGANTPTVPEILETPVKVSPCSSKVGANNTPAVPKILETPVSVSPFWAKNVENGTPAVPKILETPASVSPLKAKDLGNKTNIDNENNICQKDKIKSQLYISKQNFYTDDSYNKNDIDEIKNNFDSFEERFNMLEDTLRKSLKTSSILKQSNHNKFYAIEKRYFHLDSELIAMKHCLEQKITVQYTLVENATKQLSLNVDKHMEILLKLHRRLTNKSAIIEKNSTIMERKLNKKIAKLKKIMEDKINNEGRLLIKELSLFKVSIEDKLTKQNAAFYEEISDDLENRDLFLWTKVKRELLSLKNAENIDSDEGKKVCSNEQNSWTSQIAFFAIITLHTILTILTISEFVS